MWTESGAHNETVSAKPASATKTDILTCPAAGGIWYVIIGINICASDGSAGTATVLLYDASAAVEYTLSKAAVVPAAGSLSLTDALPPLTLEAGDILRVTPSAANQHVTVAYLEGRRVPRA